MRATTECPLWVGSGRWLDIKAQACQIPVSMRHEPIAEVRIDELGRLFVRSTKTTFDKIYRAAMGVDWDKEASAIFSPAPRDWSHSRWFEQILAAAADEYGIALTLGPQTLWTAVPFEARHHMESFAETDWLTTFTVDRAKNNETGWHEHQLQQALSQAAPYWDSERYADYVQTLMPVRDLLSPAQLKRLAIAESRVPR